MLCLFGMCMYDHWCCTQLLALLHVEYICRTLCLFGMCMYDHWCCTQLLALLHVEYICRTLCLFGMCMYDHWCCTQLLALLHVEYMSYFMFVRYVYVRSLVLYTAACFATCGVYVVLYVCSVCVCTIIGAVHSCLLCYMWSICRTLCLFGMCMYDHWCCTQLLALLHVEYMSYFLLALCRTIHQLHQATGRGAEFVWSVSRASTAVDFLQLFLQKANIVLLCHRSEQYVNKCMCMQNVQYLNV